MYFRSYDPSGGKSDEKVSTAWKDKLLSALSACGVLQLLDLYNGRIESWRSGESGDDA